MDQADDFEDGVDYGAVDMEDLVMNVDVDDGAAVAGRNSLVLDARARLALLTRKCDERAANKHDQLQPYLCLAVGCRVAVTRNLSTPLGVVNGAIGTIVRFLYPAQTGGQPFSLNDINYTDAAEVAVVPHPLIPVVLVQLDSYTGPSYLEDVERVVPIYPIKSYIRLCGSTYIREQLPLRLAKATTVHRAHGQSLSCVVVQTQIFQSNSPQMAYVAIGRAVNFDQLYILCDSIGPQLDTALINMFRRSKAKSDPNKPSRSEQALAEYRRLRALGSRGTAAEP